jgi:hypothetical protein
MLAAAAAAARMSWKLLTECSHAPLRPEPQRARVSRDHTSSRDQPAAYTNQSMKRMSVTTNDGKASDAHQIQARLQGDFVECLRREHDAERCERQKQHPCMLLTLHLAPTTGGPLSRCHDTAPTGTGCERNTEPHSQATMRHDRAGGTFAKPAGTRAAHAQPDAGLSPPAADCQQTARAQTAWIGASEQSELMQRCHRARLTATSAQRCGGTSGTRSRRCCFLRNTNTRQSG